MTDLQKLQWCLERVIWEDQKEGTRLTAKQVLKLARDSSKEQQVRALRLYAAELGANGR